MFTLKHQFNSPQADGVDPTLVKPSDWNAEHAVEASIDGVVIGRAAGAGPGDMQELPFSAILPSGVVVPYAGVAAPSGWLMCLGQIVNVADWPNLFVVLSSTYGGNGVTTFGIPDLRGRVVAAPDNGAGRLTVWGSGLGVGGGEQQVQPRVYGTVDVGVTVGGGLNGSVTGESGGGMAFGGSGVFVQAGDSVEVSGNLAGGGSGGIRNDGNNLTDTINLSPPFLMLNYMIKG
jgi:tail collar domain